jgi:hypothetical protein
MFLRLVVDQRHQRSALRQGVFVPAYRLLDGDTLLEEEHDRLDNVIDWFEEHLPLPDRSRLKPAAIFWFKSSADRLFKPMWDLVAILKEHGYHVELIKTRRPGRVCYEDAFQVAAIPYKNTTC